MSTTQRMAVGLVAAVLVGLGLFLLKDDATPAPAPAPATPAPQALAPPPPTGPVVAAEAPPVVQAGDAGPGAVAMVAAEPARPTVEYAPSPFDRPDSEELQYAVKLVLGENTGPREWHSAAQVFQRCVDANPYNHLCKRGVYAAWERIDSDGGRPTALSATGPLEVDPTKANRVGRADGIVAPALQHLVDEGETVER